MSIREQLNEHLLEEKKNDDGQEKIRDEALEVSNEQLVSWYERIRAQVVAEPHKLEFCHHGFHLFLRRGMLAWLRTKTCCSLEPSSVRRKSSEHEQTQVPEGIAEMVAILTEIILQAKAA